MVLFCVPHSIELRLDNIQNLSNIIIWNEWTLKCATNDVNIYLVYSHTPSHPLDHPDSTVLHPCISMESVPVSFAKPIFRKIIKNECTQSFDLIKSAFQQKKARKEKKKKFRKKSKRIKKKCKSFHWTKRLALINMCSWLKRRQTHKMSENHFLESDYRRLKIIK